MSGNGIGKVLESKRDGFQKGDLVSAFIGWEKYSVVGPKGDIQKIVNPNNVPIEYFLGILGMPGATAYHGLLTVGELRKGEIVYVSGAAGAVGLIVGQLAKLKGCYVLGSA